MTTNITYEMHMSQFYQPEKHHSQRGDRTLTRGGLTIKDLRIGFNVVSSVDANTLHKRYRYTIFHLKHSQPSQISYQKKDTPHQKFIYMQDMQPHTANFLWANQIYQPAPYF